MARIVEREELRKRASNYAQYCCNVVYKVRGKDFVKCKRCGKVLKDTREIFDVADSTD